MNTLKKLQAPRLHDLFRHIILAWLTAATLEYLPLSGSLRDLSQLDGLAVMSLSRLFLNTFFLAVVLWVCSCFFLTPRVERWITVGVFSLLALSTLASSYTVSYLCILILVLVLLVVYALFGHKESVPLQPQKTRTHWIFYCATAVVAVGFAVIVSVWTVCRVLSFSTPTYDFGIFSQMFYNMAQSGQPLTTVERDGLLSHFAVHVSPTYYLMLPFYLIWPEPETLQVLQAIVIASAVIPMWLIGSHHNLHGLIRTLLCALLLLLPSMSGGTSYDIHENCFLAPLVLWLLYGLDKGSIPITAVSAVLTLGVKEDAAVYVAVIALYAILRTALHYNKSRRKDLLLAMGVLVLALVWFSAATGYLAESGDGVMTYRYKNFMYNGSDSLITVIFAVLLCPMKALYECVDPEKLKFIVLTMGSLLLLPLVTRKYERYILLIPYVLMNLMSDYQYQHDIFFQYTFGSIACLMYLTAVNLADLKLSVRELKLFKFKLTLPQQTTGLPRLAALSAAVIISAGLSCVLILPTAAYYPKTCIDYADHYDGLRETLDIIPEDATVTANTFYTTYLSQRTTLYDVRYCSTEHLLSSEYVALNPKTKNDYTKYASSSSASGYKELVALLKKNGYELIATYGTRLEIYQKTN